MTPQLTEPNALAGVEACGGRRKTSVAEKKLEGMPYIRDNLLASTSLKCRPCPLTVLVEGAHKQTTKFLAASDAKACASCHSKRLRPAKRGRQSSDWHSGVLMASSSAWPRKLRVRLRSGSAGSFKEVSLLDWPSRILTAGSPVQPRRISMRCRIRAPKLDRALVAWAVEARSLRQGSVSPLL